jgi:hypothetical protein
MGQLGQGTAASLAHSMAAWPWRCWDGWSLLCLAMPLHCDSFAFEADFTADLRCIPMAVRRKLDLAGIKLKLVHWSELAEAERQQLLAWQDSPEAVAALREHLLKRTRQLPTGQASTLPLPADEPWQQSQHWPEPVLASCRQLGLEPDARGWSRLSELQRFALVKLSHPGHEHRNLPRALAEFNLVQPGR